VEVAVEMHKLIAEILVALEVVEHLLEVEVVELLAKVIMVVVELTVAQTTK